MENHGKTGEVTPLGKRFPITDFQWDTENFKSKFIRKATNRELDKVGLLK